MITQTWIEGLRKRLDWSDLTKTVSSGFWWEHPMPRSLRAYLKKEITSSDFVIHYYIAGGFSGATDFRLRGDGSYDLSSRVTKGHEHKSYSGRLAAGASQVEKIVHKMLETRIWRVRHLYATPALDDVGAKIAVTAGEQNSEVMLWVSEIREIPPFVIVQRELLTLIHQVSQGEVIEYGRGTFDLFLEEREPQTRLAQLKTFHSQAKSQLLSLAKGLFPTSNKESWQ